ncbi:DegT/DnrJ/EryC1/StrS family aminotransferase [Streptomyces sp. NPDC059762]|uniref:DegT/DnrJ/EryC1/StrS family aminotransferase n=1 Tax=Streptomyces sp. NPDC059762 TaxID=3346938 RepID=UPI00365EEBAE
MDTSTFSDVDPALLRWPAEPQQGGWYTDAEHATLAEVIRESDDWRTGWRQAAHLARFEEAFTAYRGAGHAAGFNSGGTALEMVLRALDLQAGDEVVSYAVNFVGPHVAVIGKGGRLALAEPEPATLGLDPVDAERRLTPRTRAILLTHWNGVVADVARFVELAERHPHPMHGPPKVIVDAARACGGRTPSGARVGAEGWATVFSFESKKLMTTLGQGGMVTTHDASLDERLRLLRGYGGLGRLAHCVFCEGWIYRRTWMPWPGEASGEYPDVRPDLAQHLRRRIMSRRAEQLLSDPEVLSWERALTRLAAEAPHVSRDWRPAPEAMARLTGQASRDWDVENLWGRPTAW